ncbi:sterol desaturase family protein [Sphingomonas bacterium]|uniref:sterol desaturase family protein n=1 Tax=Sphingomonas bacterium TaxID=1895847 RepID=UPI00261F317C|nr:sterol desaturase family protein [Sphingomonas bacterium]MDB5678596.1 sterol desaturase family protein [Sphingomonas bacterium]
MSFDTILLLSFPTMLIAGMALELIVRRPREQPAIRYWRLIGIVGFVATLIVNIAAPLAILPLLSWHGPMDLAHWGYWGAIPTVVLTTFFTYWSHRLQHRYDLLWRLGHQMHHGVARVDAASAFIFHPIDVFVQVFWSLLAAILLGVTPEAAGIAGAAGFLIALYQHLDVPTPLWTGWIIQRPEAHMLHHQRDVHARNFGDMPIWDMLFGTYANPRRADVAVGFEPGRAKLGPMLACIDVNKRKGRVRL